MSDPKHPKLNPHPKQAYEITITIDGAPGPFDSVTASMGFQIANASDCAPRDPISGATPTPRYYPDIALSRVNDKTYKGIFYLDFAQDENYYGKGVCHWQFIAVDAALKSHGVSFISGIDLDAITSGKAMTEYMPKRLYFGSKISDMVVGGESMSDDKAKNRDEYFSVTTTAKESSHE